MDRTNPPRPWLIALTVGDRPLWVEYSASDLEVMRGLMFRRELEPDSGMWFEFPEERPLYFWMANTFVPLSIAFVGAGGTILNIEDMEPLDRRHVLSRGPARHALEMEQGWFERAGVVAGDRVLIGDRRPNPAISSSFPRGW